VKDYVVAIKANRVVEDVCCDRMEAPYMWLD